MSIPVGLLPTSFPGLLAFFCIRVEQRVGLLIFYCISFIDDMIAKNSVFPPEIIQSEAVA